FMRDAETRFDTLRMRIEERTFTATGEHHVISDVVLRHPDAARVTTSVPGGAARGTYEVWISDGQTVRTYSGTHRLRTERAPRGAGGAARSGSARSGPFGARSSACSRTRTPLCPGRPVSTAR